MKFLPNENLFKRRFSSNQKCLRYILSVRLVAGFKCPKCGGVKFRWITGRFAVRCTQCKYRRQLSILKETVMEHTHKPLRYWFWSAYMFAKFGRYTTADFQRDFGYVRPDTITRILSPLRERLSSLGEKEWEADRGKGDTIHRLLGLL